jgi:hypothetical protein
MMQRTVLSLLGSFLCCNFLFAAPQQSTRATPAGDQATITADGAMPTANESKPTVDLVVKAAGIEVAWLYHAATYPYFLRAEPSPNREGITLTGFVPNGQLRQKALSIAVRTALEVPVIDAITVQPNMALPAWSETSKNQATIVKDQLEKEVQRIAKNVQIFVDGSGVVTITGRVDDLADRRKIIRALQGIPGCTAVRYGLYVGGPLGNPLVTQTAHKELLLANATRSGNHIPTETPRLTSNSPAAAAAAPKAGAPPSVMPVNPKPVASTTVASNSNSTKIDQSQFTISSVSGLTPPGPAIALASPVINHAGQPALLADMPALPLSPVKSNMLGAASEEVTKSVVQASMQDADVALPIVELKPTTSQPSEKVEQISVKPH